MRPENMPGYRALCVRSDLLPNDPDIAPLLTANTVDRSNGQELCLETVPILAGHRCPKDQGLKHIPFYNHMVSIYATEVSGFSFAVYGFNSGHFVNRYNARRFDVAIAADTRQCGQAMFRQFTG